MHTRHSFSVSERAHFPGKKKKIRSVISTLSTSFLIAVAWTMAADRQAFLCVARCDGSDLRRICVPFAPFYYYWSPDGRCVFVVDLEKSQLASFGRFSVLQFLSFFFLGSPRPF